MTFWKNWKLSRMPLQEKERKLIDWLSITIFLQKEWNMANVFFFLRLRRNLDHIQTVYIIIEIFFGVKKRTTDSFIIFGDLGTYKCVFWFVIVHWTHNTRYVRSILSEKVISIIIKFDAKKYSSERPTFWIFAGRIATDWFIN